MKTMTHPIFVSHAQNMEDILLWRALRHVERGSYIDIGACDPRVGSLSRGFYDLGWRGIHFEPHPVYAAALRADRPDEDVRQIALGDTEGSIPFFLVPVEGNSTGVAEFAKRPGLAVEEIRVPCSTLRSACDAVASREVHWLKIDVEGMEEAVLRGWDALVLRPWIMVVEATRPNSTELSHASWEPLVLNASYQFAFFDGLNRYYVANEHAELVPAFAAPVNVFDLAAGCELDMVSPFAMRSWCVEKEQALEKVAQLRGEVEAMRASWSWRITAPLRWMVDRVSGKQA